MDYIQLRQRSAQYAQRPGWQDIQPAPDWPTLTNQGYNDFVWQTECYQQTVSFDAVVAQAQYILPNGDWRYVYDCIYGSAPGIALVHSSEGSERRADPLFLTEPPATPARFYHTNGVLTLIPTPSDNQLITVHGVSSAPALVNDTDEPVIPAYYHEAIAYRAAWLWLKTWVGADQVPTLSGLNAEYARYCAEMRKYMATEDQNRFTRRVSRARFNRIWSFGV